MVRRHTVTILLGILFSLVLSACVPKDAALVPEVSEVSTDAAEELAAELLTPYVSGSVEEAAWLYSRFLQGDIPGYYRSGGAYWLASVYFCGDNSEYSRFNIRDLNDDGIPELYNEGPGPYCDIWTVSNGRIEQMVSLGTGWSVLPNGAIFYYRPGSSGNDINYSYKGISKKSQKYPDISLRASSVGDSREFVEFWIDSEEVSQEKWEETRDVYLVLRDAEPHPDEIAITFVEWAESLEDFALPPNSPEDVLTVESGENYSITAAEFRGETGYALTLNNSKGEAARCIRYGNTYPNVQYVSDSVFKVVKYLGSEYSTTWFYDAENDLSSPIYHQRQLHITEQLAVYTEYDGSINKTVLKVSHMFSPGNYTETLVLKNRMSSNSGLL